MQIIYIYQNISPEGKAAIIEAFCPHEFGLEDGGGSHGCTGTNTPECGAKCWDSAVKKAEGRKRYDAN